MSKNVPSGLFGPKSYNMTVFVKKVSEYGSFYGRFVYALVLPKDLCKLFWAHPAVAGPGFCFNLLFQKKDFHDNPLRS